MIVETPTPAELIETLETRGVRLQAVGDRITFEAPRGVLQDSEREALRQHKDRILAALKLRTIHAAMGLSPEDVRFVERALLSGAVSQIVVVPGPHEPQ